MIGDNRSKTYQSKVNPTIVDRLDAIPMPDIFAHYNIAWEEGRNFRCPFPAHGATGNTPSGRYYKDTNSYGCFGCHRGGGPIHFIMNMEGISFPEACDFLVNLFGIDDLPEFSYQQRVDKNAKIQEAKDHLIKFGALAEYLKQATTKNAFYRFSLLYLMLNDFSVTDYLKLVQDALFLSDKEFMANVPRKIIRDVKAALAIIERLYHVEFERLRGFDATEAMSGLFSSSHVGISWGSQEGRYVFPILLPGKVPAGFSGRALNGEFVKYQTELFGGLSKRDLIYGLDYAIPHIKEKGYVIIVEGILDVLRCRACGFYNTLSPCAAYVSEGQAILISALTDHFVLLHDNDYGGDQEAAMSEKVLNKHNLTFRRVLVPKGDDPDSYGLRDPEGFTNLLKTSCIW